jgi:hypothetical protein|tara:strand:- start:784 stop:888 length:105 start_codon:yes stop_codon:yes gene_type:complete
VLLVELVEQAKLVVQAEQVKLVEQAELVLVELAE